VDRILYLGRSLFLVEEGSREDEALVGRVLNDTYRLTRRITSGGMGVVYEAEHARLPNKHFAIKILMATVARDSQVYARFRREAEITSELGHPNIVEVLDFNKTEEGQPYIVMEFLEGESLTAIIRERGRLEPELLATILPQVGSALAVAHKRGVVHRDLKPENIYISGLDSEAPSAKVLDFGISKIRDSKTVITQDHSLLGTPFYMSPEQAQGNVGDIDQTTDTYALGTICYQALTGERPFEAASMPGVLYKICHHGHTAPSKVCPSLSSQVDDVIGKALAKDKEDRYPDMDTFVEAMVPPLLALSSAAPAASADSSLTEPQPHPGDDPAQPDEVDAETIVGPSPSMATDLEVTENTTVGSRGGGRRDLILAAAAAVVVAAVGIFVVFFYLLDREAPAQVEVAPAPAEPKATVAVPLDEPKVSEPAPASPAPPEASRGEPLEQVAAPSQPPSDKNTAAGRKRAASTGPGSTGRKKAPVNPNEQIDPFAGAPPPAASQPARAKQGLKKDEQIDPFAGAGAPAPERKPAPKKPIFTGDL